MAVTVQLRRGARADLPTTGLSAGEPLFCTDTYEAFVATDATTTVPLVVDLESLGALGTPATGDLLYMYDISAAAGSVQAKKITFDDFKTALNIPTGSTDEKVAVNSSGTAGYLWNTDGTDGVLRMGDGLGWTKDGANAYVTLEIEFASEAHGDIAVRGAAGWERLAAGTSGYLLQTNGAASNPSWTGTIDGGTFT